MIVLLDSQCQIYLLDTNWMTRKFIFEIKQVLNFEYGNYRKR